jgi:phosphonate transport system permease protein
MKHARSNVWPGLLSLLIPGSGQLLLGRWQRGLSVVVGILVLIGLGMWQALPPVFLGAAAIWLWNAWDAFRSAKGRPVGSAAPFLIGLMAVYAVAIVATEFRPANLISGYPALRPVLKALASPDLLAYPTRDRIGSAPIQVPCIQPLPRPDVEGSRNPVILASVPCASVGETMIITGTGFLPNTETALWWRNPIGDAQRLFVNGAPQSATTDANGVFTAAITVPLAVPLTQLPRPGETQTHQIEAQQHQPYGSLQPTETLRLVVQKMGETIALAFLATVLAAVLAIPVSFLAARNLMGSRRITLAVYYLIRTLLNITRSMETLIWAIIFSVWVGLGPFAGTLALLVHSIAALGKLYSEAVESIDPGPIEAIRATGANPLQVVRFGVIPQIVPTFMSFTLYRWDINVRMATVIGLVCDAGIGFLVIQWVRLGNYNAMATTIIAITLVVAILDYVSAVARQRIVAGTGLVPSGRRTFRYAVRIGAGAALVAALAWSFQVADVDLTALVRDAGNGIRLARELLVPDLVSRPTELNSVSALLPVPCGSGLPAAPASSGPSFDLSVSCGNVNEPLTILGHALPPNTRLFVRWLFPDGGELRVKEDCCDTDASGELRLDTRISPLMAAARYGGQPAQVAIQWYEAVGGLQPSDAARTTANLSLVTLLMALVATTLGSLIAIPVSFLAARNIVGRGRVGSAVYYATRTVFNLWRSIEPMILAVIFATWVGLGPFAGVLALAFNNIPNLGKLFSETIEEIDSGPVEALTATGANRLQTIMFAVVPQLVPRFLAFILYQWDINIRMSTVIGFVGGGGIGQQWRVWVQLNQYGSAAVATWAIVAMVWTMDYASARARERLV